MENSIQLYSISDRYIKFLRQDRRLSNALDNKENARSHTRKYLGVVIYRNSRTYYIPFSSPKSSDYLTDESGNFILDSDGDKIIRKSVVPIIRMVSNDSVTNKPELKGTIRISNMIPVPTSELTPYDISSETDSSYKIVVMKEYGFIKANISLINRNANNLYNEKVNENTIFIGNRKKPKYLNSTIDFTYAELKCKEFCRQNNIAY